MAKVKDQVYDGSEETYIDASGVYHFFGELFRHIMPDAYPLPTLNPTGVARRSPRGYRPPQQGWGSDAQGPRRQCFLRCTERWGLTPYECPDPAPCHRVTSKKNVWAAKIEQGVMCSYFDLWMDCCLSSCVEISVTGPSGDTYSGGAISADDDCWPCEPPCVLSTLSISYTTQQMTPGSSQTLNVNDSVYGFDVPCCPSEELIWEIISGGGTLSTTSGLSTTYTAPDENIDCGANATIKLSDCCDRTATLEIAINVVQDVYVAYEDKWSTGSDAWCAYLPYGCSTPPVYSRYCGPGAFFSCAHYDCAGNFLGDCAGHICAYIDPPNVWEVQAHCDVQPSQISCGFLSPLGITDRRTPAQIAAGCCPVALM